MTELKDKPITELTDDELEVVVSNCCGATIIEDSDFCSDCGEHTGNEIQKEEKEKLVKCLGCGNETEEWNLNRYKECRNCQTEERENDMTVGDLNK